MARQFLTLERHFGTVSYRIAKGLFALDVTSNASFVRRRAGARLDQSWRSRSTPVLEVTPPISIVLVSADTMPCPEPWGRQCDGAPDWAAGQLKRDAERRRCQRRSVSPKAVPDRRSAATGQETDTARFARERDQAAGAGEGYGRGIAHHQRVARRTATRCSTAWWQNATRLCERQISGFLFLRETRGAPYVVARLHNVPPAYLSSYDDGSLCFHASPQSANWGAQSLPSA